MSQSNAHNMEARRSYIVILTGLNRLFTKHCNDKIFEKKKVVGLKKAAYSNSFSDLIEFLAVARGDKKSNIREIIKNNMNFFPVKPIT